MLRSILFDLIGTTVKEKDNNVIDCFAKAFSEHTNITDLSELQKNRGRDKKLMIAQLLTLHTHPLTLVEPVYISFENHFVNSIENFTEFDDTADVFQFLRTKNIQIGVGTGLPRILFEKIYAKLEWEKYQLDYIGIGTEIGKSRPAPDMIFDMMQKLCIKDPAHFMKVGDTIADIQEGKNAGVTTTVVLTGAQPKADLLKESPDFVLESLKDLINIIK